MQYIQACLLSKQNFFWCFDAGLEHMAARCRGNGTNFHWLRKSCDISAGVLGDGFGALADGVLGKFTREEKTNCGLDLLSCDGGPLVVVSES